MVDVRLKPWSAFCASADCENLYGTNRLIIDVKNSALPPACPEKLIYNLASTPARASGRLGGRPLPPTTQASPFPSACTRTANLVPSRSKKAAYFQRYVLSLSGPDVKGISQ